MGYPKEAAGEAAKNVSTTEEAIDWLDTNMGDPANITQSIVDDITASPSLKRRRKNDGDSNKYSYNFNSKIQTRAKETDIQRRTRLSKDQEKTTETRAKETDIQRRTRLSKDEAKTEISRAKETRYSANEQSFGIGREVLKFVITKQERRFAEEAERATAALRGGNRSTFYSPWRARAPAAPSHCNERGHWQRDCPHPKRT
ncbi:hypothetical protein Bbelb_035780 [Branchiostoma belcheri]|nr:hypothetical protein Bbelb_035780 [Branchiostoma belcheri]